MARLAALALFLLTLFAGPADAARCLSEVEGGARRDFRATIRRARIIWPTSC